MKILYVGADSGTSRHRADAIERLGHEVTFCDMWGLGGTGIRHSLGARIHFHTGYRLVQRQVRRALRNNFENCSTRFDVVWVNNGELIGRRAATILRRLGKRLVLYVNDDPTGGRDGKRFDSLLGAIPEYDLCVVVRQQNVEEFQKEGAKAVHRVFMSYDEVAHRPLEPEERSSSEFASEIAFVGTWMPERGPLLAALLRERLPVAIWGQRWQRAPEWSTLKAAWRGPSIEGRDYARSISGARICLGMLSKGNRDLHTQRSSEIPYIGGLLCAERTSEHLAMYREGEEAVFWSDAEECVAVCRRLLSDDAERERIRLNGMRRVRELEIGNENIVRQVLEWVEQLSS
jgi:hypothetical protein